jgi:AsmA protein
MKRIIIKILKISALTLGNILLLMFLFPILFPGVVTKEIKSFTEQNLESKIEFRDANLSFFKHFPNLTFTLYNFSITGSKPFENDTLVKGKELSLGINLASFSGESLEINKLFFDESTIKILGDKDGRTNYDIYKTAEIEAENIESVPSETHLKITGITINRSRIIYKDDSFPMTFEIGNLEYLGNGQFDNNVFRLESGIFAENVSFSYDGSTYLAGKDIKGMMVTGINIDSFQFDLIKNELLVNSLPLNFNGTMSLLDDGYNIDFHMNSGLTDFSNLFSILPPEYDQWFSSTKFGGKISLNIDMAGSSRISPLQEPDFRLMAEINEGSIQHMDAPAPLEKINMKASILLPQLNTDSLALTVDPMSFSLHGENTSIQLGTKGLTVPRINLNLDSKINLDLLSQALGLDSLKFGGNLIMTAKADGIYNAEKQIIPMFDSKIKLQNGRIQTPYYPNALEQIEIDASIKNNGSTFNDIALIFEPVSFIFDQEAFAVTTSLRNFDDLQYDLEANGTLNLGNLYQLFAIDNYSVSGWLKAQLSLHGKESDAAQGKYQNLNNSGTLELKKFSMVSSDYPFPFLIPSAVLKIENDKAWLNGTSIDYDNNHIELSGYMQDFIGYSMSDKVLKGNLTIKSPLLEMEDFMTSTSSEIDTSSVTSTGVVLLPTDFDLSIDADIQEIEYNKSKVNELKGIVKLKEGKLILENTGFTIAGASIGMNASYIPTDSLNANFTFSVKADSFDVKRAYDEIPLFHELASSAASTEGLISMEYAISGRLNERMEAVYPSLKGKGFIKLENVKVRGLKLFSAVGKAVGKDSIRNPDLKAVMINSSIANNIITIEETKMKFFGFRPTFYGQTSFDGKLNLHLRLGLPPMGLVGIPMTITGTSDIPVVKIRKEREGDALEETKDDGQ